MQEVGFLVGKKTISNSITLKYKHRKKNREYIRAGRFLFALIFSSLLWFIFALKFVLSSLGNTPFLRREHPTFWHTSASYACRYFNLAGVQLRQPIPAKQNRQPTTVQAFRTDEKNQDYSDLLARVLIETEQQVKDGFMLGKFDLLVADMNELLAEIIRCTNIASSEQIERLWNKVQNGGKWSFGKVIIEVNNAQPNFQMRIYEKACTDIVLAGTIMEFCARYLSVVNMLENMTGKRFFLTLSKPESWVRFSRFLRQSPTRFAKSENPAPVL